MQTKLDGLTLTILAALGLELGCAVGPGGLDSSGTESTSNTSNTGDGDTGTPETGDSGDSSDSSDSVGGTGDSGDTSDSDDTGESGETGEVPSAYVCDNPEAILQAGTELESGFVRCEDGFVHRVEAVECVAPQGTDSALCTEFASSCSTAADCLASPYGSCQEGGFGGCVCSYGCSTDADCDADSVCACAGVAGDTAICIPAGCTTDQGCDEGLCGLSEAESCCGTNYSLACAGPEAECHVAGECGVEECYPGGETAQFQCSADFEGNWSCSAPGWCGCDCGRPFFVDGEARVAPVIASPDWLRSAKPRPVAPVTRAALAAYWAEVGQFEHASVASFARFALQLLQLGAPPTLIADTHAALGDEIEHARLAFGLASAYAGAPVGPGPLSIDTCLTLGLDAHAIVEGLIIEACVGETLAAIEAHEAGLQARDPAVAAILQAIANDEMRHARLGWRSLRWILDGADQDLCEFALRTLDAAIQIVARERPAQGRAIELREHGVLDDALRHEVREAGIAAVLRPCAAALHRRFDACSPAAFASAC